MNIGWLLLGLFPRLTGVGSCVEFFFAAGRVGGWVEFFFAPGDRSRVEYRTAGRVDKAPGAGETQRKRIKALRVALQKKGWKSVGF